MASDLGLHCLPISLLGSPDYNGIISSLQLEEYLHFAESYNFCKLAVTSLVFEIIQINVGFSLKKELVPGASKFFPLRVISQ